jgi:hypothetical protein
MVLSIGIDCNGEDWRASLLENGRTLELRPLNDVRSALEYVRHICSFYPEPVIVVSARNDGYPTHLTATANAPVSNGTLPHNHGENKVHDFLLALESVYFNTYYLPSIRQLTSVPLYRKQYRLDMGSSGDLCAVTTLTFRMRKQEASWQEMRFFYLTADCHSRSILVVEDGRIVDGVGETSAGFSALQHGATDHVDWQGLLKSEAIAEQAYWESLTQDLAGLMAIHHLEDIVVNGQRKDNVIEWLNDRYQCYLFPRSDDEQPGYEVAIGAAIIAEGLYHPGLAIEVVERLQVSPIKLGMLE